MTRSWQILGKINHDLGKMIARGGQEHCKIMHDLGKIMTRSRKSSQHIAKNNPTIVLESCQAN